MDVAVFAEAVNQGGWNERFGMQRDNNMLIVHQWELKPNTGQYSDWGQLSGPLQGASDLCVGTNADGRLEVFVTNGAAAYHAWQIKPNGGTGWSTWNIIGGDIAPQSFAGVMNNADGHLELFGIIAPQGLSLVYHAWQGGSGPSGWSNWGPLNENNTPVVRILGMGFDGQYINVEVYLVSDQNPLAAMSTQSPNGWTPWQLLD
jgi:hypothetical protein